MSTCVNTVMDGHMVFRGNCADAYRLLSVSYPWRIEDGAGAQGLIEVYGLDPRV